MDEVGNGERYYAGMRGGGRCKMRVVDEARKCECGSVWITASDMGVLLYTNFGFVKNGNFMQYKL